MMSPARYVWSVAGAVALLGTAFFSGCQNRNDATSMLVESIDSEAAWGGLIVQTVGTDIAHARHAVIMLHGFGVAGNDLVPMGRVMPAAPLTCFVFPEAPIELDNGGRAWWNRQGGFDEARDQVQSLLQYIKQVNSQVSIVMGGFSQGAILASNFLAEEPRVLDGAILLAPSGRTRHPPRDIADKPIVFLAHGRDDPALPFAGSEQLYQQLVDLNYEVQWMPFEGGHDIPQEVKLAVARFLARIQGDVHRREP